MKQGLYLLRRFGWLLPVIVLLAAAAYVTWFVMNHHLPVLGPGGEIGRRERDILIIASILSFIVVVPVFGLAIFIAWRYRESNHDKAGKRPAYKPEFDHSRLFESIWWGIPIVIIAVLSVITWQTSHSLDPYKQLAGKDKMLTIEVVSLDWKWLFIYPEQHIASVNLAVIPTDQPVKFKVTSDTIMNSFWVPGLGGQIYAMPGMVTQMHHKAEKPGDYFGSPANIAGEGFARMDFTIRATSDDKFNKWIELAQQSKRNLTSTAYAELAKPSADVPVSYYSPVQDGLYNDIVMHYMMPPANDESNPSKNHHDSMSHDAMMHSMGAH